MGSSARRRASPWLWFPLFYFGVTFQELQRHPAALPWIALNLGVALFAAFVAVSAHELGHAVCARIAGLEVLELVIGRGKGALAFTVAGCRVQLRSFPLGGTTFVAPQSLRAVRTRLWWMFAGGPLASIGLFAWVTAPMWRLWSHGVPFWVINHGFWFSFRFRLDHALAFHELVAFFAACGALNLIPFVSRSEGRRVRSDGLQLLTLPFRAQRELRLSLAAPHELRALRAVQAGDFRVALAEMDDAVRRLPDEPGLQLLRSVALIGLMRFDEARAALLPLLEDADRPAALRAIAANNVAWAIVEGGLPQLEEADALSEQAMQLAGAQGLVRNTRGAVLVLRGRPAEGLALLEASRDAARTTRDRASVASMIALARSRLGDSLAAERSWAEAERADPTAPLVARTRALAREEPREDRSNSARSP